LGHLVLFAAGRPAFAGRPASVRRLVAAGRLFARLPGFFAACPYPPGERGLPAAVFVYRLALRSSARRRLVWSADRWALSGWVAADQSSAGQLSADSDPAPRRLAADFSHHFRARYSLARSPPACIP